MKKLLLILFLSLAALPGFAQTVNADRVTIKSGLYLKDWWVDSIKRDTNFQFAARSIPTAAAVHDFIVNRLKDFTPSSGSNVTEAEKLRWNASLTRDSMGDINYLHPLVMFDSVINGDTAVFVTIQPDVPLPYDIPIATPYVLGGIKVGSGLDVDSGGTLNADTTNFFNTDFTAYNDRTHNMNYNGLQFDNLKSLVFQNYEGYNYGFDGFWLSVNSNGLWADVFTNNYNTTGGYGANSTTAQMYWYDYAEGRNRATYMSLDEFGFKINGNDSSSQIKVVFGEQQASIEVQKISLKTPNLVWENSTTDTGILYRNADNSVTLRSMPEAPPLLFDTLRARLFKLFYPATDSTLEITKYTKQIIWNDSLQRTGFLMRNSDGTVAPADTLRFKDTKGTMVFTGPKDTDWGSVTTNYDAGLNFTAESKSIYGNTNSVFINAFRAGLQSTFTGSISQITSEADSAMYRFELFGNTGANQSFLLGESSADRQAITLGHNRSQALFTNNGIDIGIRSAVQNPYNLAPTITGLHINTAGQILLDVPTFADNTAAASLPANTLYKTATGELKIKY